MTRRWAAGGDHRFMQAAMVHIHITGVVHVHHLGLVAINPLLNMFDQIEPIQRIKTIVRQIKEFNPAASRIDPATCAAWAKAES
jgi:hypothetical protein